MEKPIYIREVAAAAGVTPQAVRYYERLGLLEKPQRNSSGYRVYSSEALERMNFIKRAQELGLNLAEIRVILQMKCTMQPPCDCVRDMLKKKLARIERQIAQMEAMRREVLNVLQQSRNLPSLGHEESLICPLIEKPARGHGSGNSR